MTAAIRAEMVASIGQIYVAAGDKVAVGDTLLIMESMKMEIPVLAEQAGTVAEVQVATGDVVHEGDILLELS